MHPDAAAWHTASNACVKLASRSCKTNFTRVSAGHWLSADQHHDYQAWIDNDRRLRELLTRLEALGTAALEADPRWDR